VRKATIDFQNFSNGFLVDPPSTRLARKPELPRFLPELILEAELLQLTPNQEAALFQFDSPFLDPNRFLDGDADVVETKRIKQEIDKLNLAAVAILNKKQKEQLLVLLAAAASDERDY